MAKQTTNRKARELVKELKSFRGSNTYGMTRYPNGEKMYMVFSYGEHWPLFIFHYDTCTWFENEDKYSPTTSKHKTQLHPGIKTRPLPVARMKDMAAHGLVAALAPVNQSPQRPDLPSLTPSINQATL